MVSGAAADVAAPFSLSSLPTLEAGFFDPALEAGFFDVDGGLADERDAGLADPAREAFDAGLLEVPAACLPAPPAALDGGFDAALEGGFDAAFEAGLALFAGGGCASSTAVPFAAVASSASISEAVLFFPFACLGSSALSSVVLSAAFAFFARGFAGAFLLVGSGLGWSLMRAERRGASVATAAALRGMLKKRGGG